MIRDPRVKSAFGETDWSRYLLGACSSGEVLRPAVVRNADQVKALRAEVERLRAIEGAYLDAFGEYSPEAHELIRASVVKEAREFAEWEGDQ